MLVHQMMASLSDSRVHKVRFLLYHNDTKQLIYVVSDQYILKKFLKHNSNKHPPTRVKQDSDGTKFRVYCYPGNVVHLMQEWTAEWESLPANKK